MTGQHRDHMSEAPSGGAQSAKMGDPRRSSLDVRPGGWGMDAPGEASGTLALLG